MYLHAYSEYFLLIYCRLPENTIFLDIKYTIDIYDEKIDSSCIFVIGKLLRPISNDDY